ncbi:hypothetical protein [Paraburkholderia sediminicola]|uniref:hypothetical protein n=1 Tax=Paraburkholderia sediminicola TaxID=458836 RepID=UPI0038B8100A
MLSGTLDEYRDIKHPEAYVLWCTMGFYPDLRIFQNEPMCDLMGFQDDVDTFFLPMGVSD